jgi:hypothetical protein
MAHFMSFKYPFLLRFFLTSFIFLCFFFFTCTKFQQDVVNLNALYKSVVTKLIHKNEFQKSITINSIDMFVIFFNKCFLIQVENLHMITNLVC